MSNPVFRICIHRTLDDEEVHVAIPDLVPLISASAVKAWRAEPLREREIARQVTDAIRKAFYTAKPFAVLDLLRKYRARNRLRFDESVLEASVLATFDQAEENVVEAWTKSPLRSSGTVAGAEAVIREAIIAALDDAMLRATEATVRI